MRRVAGGDLAAGVALHVVVALVAVHGVVLARRHRVRTVVALAVEDVVVVFTVELLVNMAANLWWKFVMDWWCRFDLLIVSMSLLSLGSMPIPSGIIRLLRAFRVIRFVISNCWPISIVTSPQAPEPSHIIFSFKWG